MFVSVSQVSRLRIHLLRGSYCCERFHGWLKNNASPKPLDLRSSSVDGSSRWIRRILSTTTQGSRSNTKSSVLGRAVPVTRLIDAESTNKQRLAGNKHLSKLLTVIVYDSETTGSVKDKDRIIEIAAQDLAGGENSTFQTLINPGSDILIRNYSVHGIENYMVLRPEVPSIEEMIPIFLKYVQSRQKPGGYVMIVAHNGKSFDFRFLISEFKRCGFKIPHNWLFLDSLPLAREYMKSVDAGTKLSSSLIALGKYYNLSRDGQAHRALSDVSLLSQVFQRLTIDLKLSLSDLVLRACTASDITAAMEQSKKARNVEKSKMARNIKKGKKAGKILEPLNS